MRRRWREFLEPTIEPGVPRRDRRIIHDLGVAQDFVVGAWVATALGLVVAAVIG